MNLPKLHLDFETRSEVSVRDVGPHAYATHDSTEVIAMAWIIENTKGELHDVDTWHFAEGPIRQPILGEFMIHAHNAAFERCIWNEILVPRFGFAYQPIKLFRCSSARAAMLGLPGSLDQLAEALDLETKKDKEGGKLMREMTVPVNYLESPNMFGEVGAIYRDRKTDFERLAEYCATDVEVEVLADEAMGPMPDRELKVWLLDQQINSRGIRIDRYLCDAAIQIVTDVTERRASFLDELTGGVVTAATQPERIREWLKSRNVDTPNGLGADIVDALLSDQLPGDENGKVVRRVLEIRRDTAKSSTAKFRRMLDRSQTDGRMRDNLRYHGAFTGRWSGSGAQIQNYPRGKVKADEELADTFLDRDEASIELLFGDPVDAAKSILRGCLIPAEGKKLLVWDFGQIEARGLPWLAGESWKLDAFREIDADKSLPDIYERSFAKSFDGNPMNVTNDERQVGKVCELALGYQGGPGAFVSMQKIYRMDIADYFDTLVKMFPETASKAEDAYNRRGVGSGIDEQTWIAAEICKLNWRAKHPRTVSLWHGLEDAAIEAMKNGKSKYEKVRFQRHGEYLKMILPSRHVISYFRPSIDENGYKPQLAYRGTLDGRLIRRVTYGGKLAQNATESVARSAMVDAMFRLDGAGFDIIGTVHDEIICECDESIADEKLIEGKRLMETNARWSDGFPLVASGDVMNRYRK